ncbi:MAG: zinc-binding dehydrogenase [Desulfobacterales bacterium]|nr:zinc-binding dehydrogenase [Desulfobacterales bacterium]
MKRRAVVFLAPGRVETALDPVPEPADDEVLVQVEASAISAGTELLVYRGQAPPDLPVDACLPGFSGLFRFPLRYGYAAAGSVAAAGRRVDPAWIGRRVFGFRPHASHFLSRPAELVPIPESVGLRDAVFLANMETAATLMLDGLPAVGEHVVVFGQGVVGLLASGLLSAFPLASLSAVEPLPLRQEASLRAGVHAVFDPARPQELIAWLREATEGAMADLVFELSGHPPALDAAIAAAGFGARIVLGSWYGGRPAAANLGGSFHRSRIRLIGSQVSTLPPAFMARWSRQRRFAVAWEQIRRTGPARLITHEFAVEAAGEAYALLDRNCAQALQVLLTYGH